VNHPKFVSLAAWVGLLLGILGTAVLAASDNPHLATGPGSEMHMLLKRTIFSVHVLALTIQYDGDTQTRIKDLVAGKRYSDDLAQEVAAIVYKAKDLKVTMQFQRDVGFGRFIDEVSSNVDCAKKAGVIDAAEHDRVVTGLRSWFGPLSSRGIKDQDQLIYTIGPDTFLTHFQSSSGQTFVDRLDHEAQARLSLLGGFLAPCSDFHEPLVKSLLR